MFAPEPKITVYIDIDGVLANLMKKVREVFHGEVPEQTKDWIVIFKEKRYFY